MMKPVIDAAHIAVLPVLVTVGMTSIRSGPRPDPRKMPSAEAYMPMPIKEDLLPPRDPVDCLLNSQSPDARGALEWMNRVMRCRPGISVGPVIWASLLVCGVKIIALDAQIIQPQWCVKPIRLDLLRREPCEHLHGPDLPRKMEIVVPHISLAFQILGTLAMNLVPDKSTSIVVVAAQALSAGAHDTFKSLPTGFRSSRRTAEPYPVIAL
ncbi:hypothetical protein F5B21DRAFT_510172 [Xylaria acuta]|nr:hypothetical protein F5B21DRAFT_510172 [Xylaria acuta]